MSPFFLLALFLSAHVAATTPCQDRFAQLPSQSPEDLILGLVTTWPHEDLPAPLKMTSYYDSSAIDLAHVGEDSFVVTYVKLDNETQTLTSSALLFPGSSSSSSSPVPLPLPFASLPASASLLFHVHSLPDNSFVITQSEASKVHVAIFHAGSSSSSPLITVENFCEVPPPGNPGYLKIVPGSQYLALLCWDPADEGLKIQLVDFLENKKTGRVRSLGTTEENIRNIFGNGLSVTPTDEFFVAYNDESDIVGALIKSNAIEEITLASVDGSPHEDVISLQVSPTEVLALWLDTDFVKAQLLNPANATSAINTASCPLESDISRLVSATLLPNDRILLVWSSDDCEEEEEEEEDEFFSVSLVSLSSFRNATECFNLTTTLEAFTRFEPKFSLLPTQDLLAHFTRPTPFSNSESDWGLVYDLETLAERSLPFPIDNSRPHSSQILSWVDSTGANTLLYPSRPFDCQQGEYKGHWRLLEGSLAPVNASALPTQPPWTRKETTPAQIDPFDATTAYCADLNLLFEVDPLYPLQFVLKNAISSITLSSAGLSAFDGLFRGVAANSDAFEVTLELVVGDGLLHSSEELATLLLHTDPPHFVCEEDELVLTAHCDLPFSFWLDTCFDNPAGGELSYNATLSDGKELPEWLLVTETNLTISGTAPAAPGVYLLALTVDNGDLESLVKVVKLTVAQIPIETTTTAEETTTTTEETTTTTAEETTTTTAEETTTTTTEETTTTTTTEETTTTTTTAEETTTTTTEETTTTTTTTTEETTTTTAEETTTTTQESPPTTTASATPTATPTVTPTATVAPTATKEPEEEGSVPTGLVVTVAVFIFVIGATAVSFLWRRFSSRQRQRAYRPVGHQRTTPSMMDDDYELQELNPFNH